MIPTANRLNEINEYYFSHKLREIESLNAQGKNIISLGIGSPDLAPHPSVVEALHQNALLPNTHGYQSYKGSPILRNAFANFYKTYYNVTLNPDTDILPLIGSKEGIMHICMTFINNGDKVLIPNPGYPTYTSAAKIAGATLIEYNLTEANNFQPDFDELETKAEGVKLMFLNYPHMPTGQLPDRSVFQKLITFSKAKNILIVHDNPYSFILNDNPISILNEEGALDVVIELNSLSKSHNMAGWRIGSMCSNQAVINEVLRFKSNMDSGMFLPLQMAAVSALSLPKAWFAEVNNHYQIRREIVFQLLDKIGCTYSKNQSGLFVWAKVPQRFLNSTNQLGAGAHLSDEILYKKNVFITPGGIFGNQGNNFVRLSLCCKEDKIKEALDRI